MHVAIPCFAMGVWLCQQLAQLPSLAVLGLCVALVVPAAWLCQRYFPRSQACGLAVVAVLLGLTYATWRADMRVADQLSLALEGQDVEITGYIADLPDRGERALRFVFEADVRQAGVPSRLMLSWYGQLDDESPAAVPRLRAGERWQLRVRLHRPHSSLNPHGFDYEAWLFERGIRAVGYVRAKGDNRRLEVIDRGATAHLQHARQVVRERFERVLPQGAYAGVLAALAIGDQGAIPVDSEN